MPDRIPFEQEVPRCLGATTDQSSHIEPDPGTFHASQLPYCRRQAYLRKFGLLNSTRALGRFALGDLLHEQMRGWFETRFPHLEFEVPVSLAAGDGISIIGHADCYDPRENVVYEFKSRANWWKLSRPHNRHRKQVESYLRGLDAAGGQIVYLSRKDFEVQFDPQLYPEDVAVKVVSLDPLEVAFVDGEDENILPDQPDADDPAFFAPDDERYLALIQKAQDIRDAVLEGGIATCEEEIPFDPCDCFYCSIERLNFQDVPALEADGATSNGLRIE
jgi:CRISPR-associated exonuclease Cas4